MLNKLSDHIVVCGHGRMGRATVEVLQERRVPFVVVDIDESRCRQLAEAQIPFIIGDATQEPVLRTARVDRAQTFSPASPMMPTTSSRSCSPGSSTRRSP